MTFSRFNVHRVLDDLTKAELRTVWWRQRRLLDTKLPAERGIIVIEGGREYVGQFRRNQEQHNE